MQSIQSIQNMHSYCATSLRRKLSAATPPSLLKPLQTTFPQPFPLVIFCPMSASLARWLFPNAKKNSYSSYSP